MLTVDGKPYPYRVENEGNAVVKLVQGCFTVSSSKKISRGDEVIITMGSVREANLDKKLVTKEDAMRIVSFIQALG